MFFGSIDDNIKAQLQLGLGDYEQYKIFMDRRIYLTTQIVCTDDEDGCDDYYRSATMRAVEDIMDFNRADIDVPVADRKPIRIYINSPGGDIAEGFSLLSAIELSKTPIYTINIGQWSSMAFLIGIAGHRRFSLPYMTFLMHDGSSGVFDSGSKAQDRMKFDDHFSNEVIKKHVLKHSNMKAVEYDALVRVEYYMLPEDALEHGFIDEIVEDIDTIL
jgi:ATP-dependent Clp protease protease subunit